MRNLWRSFARYTCDKMIFILYTGKKLFHICVWRTEKEKNFSYRVHGYLYSVLICIIHSYYILNIPQRSKDYYQCRRVQKLPLFSKLFLLLIRQLFKCKIAKHCQNFIVLHEYTAITWFHTVIISIITIKVKKNNTQVHIKVTRLAGISCRTFYVYKNWGTVRTDCAHDQSMEKVHDNFYLPVILQLHDCRL